MPFEIPILELQQVPEQTRAVFETIASAKSDIINAKERRVTLAKQYNSDDLVEYDRSVQETEAALAELEKLVESARMDFQHNDGRIRAKTRLMWLVRDSKTLFATNNRLTLARSQLSFATTTMHMRSHHNRTQRSAGGVAPSSYASHRRPLPQEGTEDRSGVHSGKSARSRSLNSVDAANTHVRPVMRTRTTMVPTLNRQEEDFDNQLNQHEQVRPPPPIGPLLISVEALNNKYDVVHQSTPTPHDRNGSTNQARPENPGPSVSLISLDRRAMEQVNYSRLQHRITISPPITPPDSPRQRAMSSLFPSTSELETVSDNRGRMFSLINVNRLPTVLETSSIRFELDASQEVRAPGISELLRVSSRNVAPIASLPSTERKPVASPTTPSQARQLRTLPYPDHQDSDVNLRTMLEHPPAPDTKAFPPATKGSLSGLKSTPYFFAGHRQPVNIRWLPEPGEVPRSEPSKHSDFFQSSSNKMQKPTPDFVYQPYRPM